MHHDPVSARDLAAQDTLLRGILWVMVFLLFAFVLALALRNRDAIQRIEELEGSAEFLSVRVGECENLRDDLADLERRVGSTEAQFWE